MALQHSTKRGKEQETLHALYSKHFQPWLAAHSQAGEASRDTGGCWQGGAVGGSGPSLLSPTHSGFCLPLPLSSAQRRFCGLELLPKGPQGLPSLPRAGRHLVEEPEEDAPQRARLPRACPPLSPGRLPSPALRGKEGRWGLGAARVSQGRGAGVSGESIS